MATSEHAMYGTGTTGLPRWTNIVTMRRTENDVRKRKLERSNTSHNSSSTGASIDYEYLV